MKYLTFLVLWFLVSTPAFSQFPKDEKTGEVVYSDIIQMEGYSKEEIHDKAKFWIVSTLKSGDNMVELDGDNSDKIVGTGNLYLDSILFCSSATLNFKFIVFCKDGRLKYSVENFLMTVKSSSSSSYKSTSLEKLDYPYYGATKKARAKWNKQSEIQVNKQIRIMIDDFINEMKTKSEDDDW